MIFMKAHVNAEMFHQQALITKLNLQNVKLGGGKIELHTDIDIKIPIQIQRQHSVRLEELSIEIQEKK